MSRIGTFGASQLYMSRIIDIQQRIKKTQTQGATEKTATAYSGIAADANRLLNVELEKTQANQFIHNNTLANVRLSMASTSMDAVQTTIRDFKNRLQQYRQNGSTSATDIEGLQDWAFRAMSGLQSLINVKVDGEYIFSGGKTNTPPVKLAASTLQEYQKLYDGDSRTVPTTRSAALMEFNFNQAHTGAVTFDTANGTVTAATAGAFKLVQPGSTVSIGGMVPAKTFTVGTVDPSGNSFTVARLTSETAGAATVSFGDTALTNADTGALTFSPQGDTITGATAGSLAGLTPGTVFKIAGTGSNDGVYEVAGYDAATNRVSIKSVSLDMVQPTTSETAATLSDGVTNRVTAQYGQLSFGADANGALQISSSTANAFNGIYAAGSTITVSGASDPANNGTYRVLATNDNNTLTVSRVDAGGPFTVPADGPLTISSDSWYEGDTIVRPHRTDANQTVDLGIFASDPAIEKAMRAFSLIAQGAYGTAGGLENHLERIDQALYLLADSLSSPIAGTPPFGTEARGDIAALQSKIAVTQSTLNAQNSRLKTFIGFLDQQIINLENVDKTEAVVRLLDDQTALETSYKALAEVRRLSLMQFLK